MPQDNYEEGHIAGLEREGRREERNGGTTQAIFLKTAYTLSDSFQDIRVTKMLAFRG